MTTPAPPLIGVLALQGDFRMHAEALAHFGLGAREVRAVRDLADLAGFVLPGGESTTMLNLLAREELEEPLRAWLARALADELPVLATCAGVILAAHRVARPAQRSLDLLDVDVERNAYGRQLASGICRLTGESGFPDCAGTFIRAPRITRIGPGVRVLARRDGDPVLVREGALLAATFHPEMDALHPASALFAERVRAHARNRPSPELTRTCDALP